MKIMRAPSVLTSVHVCGLLIALHCLTAEQPVNEQSRPNTGQFNFDNINKYEIVTLNRVDTRGNQLPVEHHFPHRRRRRSLSNSADGLPYTAHYELIYAGRAFGRSIKLVLAPRSQFIVEDLVVQHMAANETWMGENLHEGDRHCFHVGRVEEDPGSSAVINTCDERLLGVIQAFNELYYIEPFIQETKDSRLTSKKHIIYQRNVTSQPQSSHWTSKD